MLKLFDAQKNTKTCLPETLKYQKTDQITHKLPKSYPKHLKFRKCINMANKFHNRVSKQLLKFQQNNTNTHKVVKNLTKRRLNAHDCDKLV